MMRIPKLTSATKEQLLIGLIHSASDICIVTNTHRIIQLVNPAVLYKTGYREEELIGKKDTILLQKDWRSVYTSRVFKRLADEGKWNGELSFETKNGELLPLQLVVRAMYDKNGKFSGSMITGYAMADKQNERQQFWKSEGKLDRIVRSLHDAVLLFDKSGRILMNNPAFCRMLGYSSNECLGSLANSVWLEASEHKRLRHALSITLNEGSISNVLLSGKRKDHTRIIFSCSFSLLKNECGEVETYIGTFRDVTNVHYADELSKTNERLDRLTSEVHRKTAMVEALNEIHRLIMKKAPIEKIFQTSMNGVKRIVEHDLAGIYVYEPIEKKFFPSTMSKQTTFSKKIARFPLTLGEGIIGSIAASKDVILVNNAQNDPRSKYPQGMKPPLEHFIAVAMKNRSTLYGVLVVARNRDPEFIEEEAQLMKSFADATTIALDNARLLNPMPLVAAVTTSNDFLKRFKKPH